jgi:queuine/archaeosine tRNA-ribosyltransferase
MRNMEMHEEIMHIEKKKHNKNNNCYICNEEKRKKLLELEKIRLEKLKRLQELKNQKY